MDRKNIPLLLMLTAGGITCIITFVMKFSVLAKLVSLFFVLLVFYVLGSALKWALDSFDRQNEEAREAAKEAEKETAEGEETQENVEVNSSDEQ